MMIHELYVCLRCTIAQDDDSGDGSIIANVFIMMDDLAIAHLCINLPQRIQGHEEIAP